MKTLKKSLCLILSVIMVVGVLAVSASAATFTDSESIQYTEAVEVLSAIKVIDGVGDGSFAPTATLTREQGAAIVIRALLTRAVSDNLGASGVAFSDVPASWWSAGVVNEAAARGIINGVGDGTFAPGAELTVAQFAKMLLVAIGVEGEYTGSNWYNNVIVAATKVGLADGITGINYNAGITREEACQMAYNAINYSVNGKSVSYVVTENVTDKVLYEGTDALMALVMKQSADKGATLKTDTVTTGSIADSVYGLVNGNTTDPFGRPTVVVTGKNNVEVKVIDEPTLTFEGVAVKKSALATALGASKNADEITLTVIEDGVSGTETITKNSENTIGAVGALTEVYKTGKNTATVIVINTYVGTVTKVTPANAAKEVDASIIIDRNSDLEFKTDAFKKDDVVLYSKTFDENGKATVRDVVKADYVSGSVTATASNYIRVDGEKYVVSAKSGLEIGTGLLTLSKTGEVNTYYLDTYGNIISAAVGETDDPDTNYVYVIQTASKAKGNDSTGDNLFETTAGSAARAQAQVLNLATGEVSVVNIGVVNSKGTYYYAKANGSASTEVVDDGGERVGAIWAYTTLEDGSIVLVDEADLTAVELEAKSAQVDTANKYYANSSTVLTIVDTTSNKEGVVVSAKVGTYTGIANFPTVKNTQALVVADKNGLASSIVIVRAEDITTSVNYAVYAGKGETDSEGTKVSFHVGGETVEYYDKTESGLFVKNNEDSVFDITVANGEVTAAKVVEAADKQVEITAVDSTYIRVGGKIMYLASSVEVYDSTDKFAEAEYGVGDYVDYYTNTKGEIALIVLVEAPEAD